MDGRRNVFTQVIFLEILVKVNESIKTFFGCKTIESRESNFYAKKHNIRSIFIFKASSGKRSKLSKSIRREFLAEP